MIKNKEKHSKNINRSSSKIIENIKCIPYKRCKDEKEKCNVGKNILRNNDSKLYKSDEIYTATISELS